MAATDFWMVLMAADKPDEIEASTLARKALEKSDPSEDAGMGAGDAELDQLESSWQIPRH